MRMLARDIESYDELVRRLFAADARVRCFRTLVIIRQVKDASPVPTG